MVLKYMDSTAIANIAAAAERVAKTALDVAESLLTSIQYAKSVRDSTKALQVEVKSFGDACQSLKLLLNNLSEAERTKFDSESKTFCIHVHESLTEYGRTIDLLEKDVQKAIGTKAKLFAKAWREAKLKLKKEDVAIYRDRIDLHTTSSQMILSIASL